MAIWHEINIHRLPFPSRSLFLLLLSSSDARFTQLHALFQSYRQGHLAVRKFLQRFREIFPQARPSPAAAADSRTGLPSGCPRTLQDGVTAARRKAALGT